MKHSLVLLLLLAAFVPLDFAHAKNKGLKIADPSTLKDVELPGVKPFTCMKNKKGVFVYGKATTNKKGEVRFKKDKKDKKKLRKLKGKKKRAKNKKARKKASKALTALKALIAEKKSACANDGSDGPGDPDESDGGDPSNPLPKGDPLKPLDRAVTVDDLNLLLERAAFGRGSLVAEGVISQGLSSGLDAAITYLTTRRAESTSVMNLVQDWADGEINEEAGQDRRTDADADPDIDEQPDQNGIENALYFHAMTTTNPFFYKVAMDLLLPQFTVNHDWFDVQPGVNTGEDPWEQWYYYEKLLFDYSNNADIRKMAEELLNRRVFLEQYDNTSNTSSGLSYKYAQSVLSHILPATNSEGVPTHTHRDVVELSKVLSGWMVINLDDEMLPVFSSPNHVGGNKKLFEGTENACSADRLNDYLNDCAFSGDGASLYYARKILEYYLTPNPPAALVSALGEEIRISKYQLVPAIKKLFRSSVFFDPAYRNRVPKNPIEVMVSFSHSLDIPLRTGEDANAGDGLRSFAERTGYHLARIPLGGYPVEMWSGVQHAITMRNVMERAFEDVEDAELNNQGNPIHFYGDYGFDVTEYLPGGQEVLSDDLLDNAINVLGVPLGDFPEEARSALKYYILHRRLSNDNGDQFFPYDNVNDHQGKGFGIYIVLGGSLPFIFK